jgi:hypothetical protein
VIPDYLSQWNKNDKVRLLLSHPAKGTPDYNARRSLITNYVNIDIVNISFVSRYVELPGIPRSPHFGINSNTNFGEGGYGSGFAALGIAAGSTGNGASYAGGNQVLLLPMDVRDPLNSEWYALIIHPINRNLSGGEANQGSNSLGFKNVSPDTLFSVDRQGNIVAVAIVNKPVNAKVVSGDDSRAAQAYYNWTQNTKGTPPPYVIPLSRLSNSSLAGATPLVYEYLFGY